MESSRLAGLKANVRSQDDFVDVLRLTEQRDTRSKGPNTFIQQQRSADELSAYTRHDEQARPGTEQQLRMSTNYSHVESNSEGSSSRSSH